MTKEQHADAEYIAIVNTTSKLVHNGLVIIAAVVALIYNRKGPNWIKGFIVAILVSCVTGLIDSTLRRFLLKRFPIPEKNSQQESEDSW